MVITPHALAGAALATYISDPFTLAVSAIALHHALDIVPHWDYDIMSSKKATVLKIAADAMLAGILTLALIRDLPIQTQAMALFGGFFGVLPDVFLGLYLLSGKKIFTRYARFHIYLHYLSVPKGHKPHPALGLGTQIFAMLAVLAVFVSL